MKVDRLGDDLSDQVCYNDLGDLYLDKLNKHYLERLGYTVKLEQKAG